MSLNYDMTEADLACHCGAVRLHVKFENGLHTARRCTCSLCRMRGAIAVSVALNDLAVVAGQDALSLYQFNTNTAEHYFCSKCGIYTHHRRRSNPNQYGVNVACIEGVSPFDFVEVQVLNGQSHPNDVGGLDREAGVLRFFPNT